MQLVCRYTLGDLAFRFPNAVEPWTEHLYGLRTWGNSLHDADAGVRQHAITVLAHLVLNDMVGLYKSNAAVVP
jgi:condensin complex subunit 1